MPLPLDFSSSPVETQLTANGTAQISQRLLRLGKELGSWKQKQSVAAFGLVLAMAMVAAGCNVTREKDTQEAKQLKAQVAALEKRMSEMEKLLPPKGQVEQEERQRAYRERFDRRRELDRKKYTQEQMTEAEAIYIQAVSSSNWGSPEHLKALKQLLEKFPEANRTGCALLDWGESAPGPESVKYFEDCIHQHNDCYYGDGVQVGAYARLSLANYYNRTGENQKAVALFKEIKDNYSDSIDHCGRLLIDLIK